ncbi:uncharacterized protein Cda5 isoform X1 [Chelonus insularis]|uniref:uncharacterized protein Cda5 isoform X1 n=1 Tax=Chelonus insularis TaxID=460826 RepID=UPI00158BD091|nr:uncharacterized protein LOC118067404 isoform X1 [Chelonus insularis]
MTTTTVTTTTTTSSGLNISQVNDKKDYAIHEATKRNYVIVSSPSPFKLPPKDDDPITSSLVTTTVYSIQNNQELQVNRNPSTIVNSPVSSILPQTNQIPSTSSSIFDEPELNEISASSPIPRKRPLDEFDDESSNERGNYATLPTTIKQRIKARIAQRGRERYHGFNYVTMKVIRKRPVIDRDQDGKDSFKNDVTIPLIRSTTPLTPSTTSPEQRKNIISPQKTSEIINQFDNIIPTTLNPLQRALIINQLQRDQDDIEGNEITSLNTKKFGKLESKKNNINNTVSKLSQSVKSYVTKLELLTSPTPFRKSTPTSITSSSMVREDVEKNEIVTSSTLQSSLNQEGSRPEKKDVSTDTPVSRQRQHNGPRKTSSLEREKETLVNTGRTQTDNQYRSIQSENQRIVKTTTPAPVISKSYYDHDSYPYYLYDDDVSIYKDDDYAQYTINQSIPLPPPQQQNVRIAEVTPNSKPTYTQKTKKVPVNDADKYNYNSEVTASDYDIYDTQGHLNKNKFHINDNPQTYSRGRPHINRGTAPPRLRPTLKPSTEVVAKAQEYIDIYRYPPSRPEPIYPTPQVDKPAAKCRKDVCLLPDCSCGGADIPGDYLPEEIPQIVLLTFDDSVNDLNKGLYADLFEKGRKNPNGCPISATFYVSHEWTDYSQVQNLYAAGHEIASHTVSHSFGEQFSAKKWAREVAGQREILAAYGGVKLEDVRGMRAPFLSVGGNNMFKMLWETNFTYDSSMPIYENRPPSWPYTLDYKLFHDCMIPPCPTRSYPGLWEVPMVMWQDLNGGRCSMGDACSNPPTADGVYKMLIKNFERHYTTNRAPFGLFYHAAWFTQAHHKEGFISFLDTIAAMDDVWIVTNWQAIQWVRNPTPLALLDTFEPFGCNYQDRPKKCNNAKVCNLWHKSGVRYMKTCQACPDIYPWTGKTGIRSSRIDNDIEN